LDNAERRRQAAEDAEHERDNDGEGEVAQSPTGISEVSYEMFVGQPKGMDDDNNQRMERISLRSDGGDSVLDHRGRLSNTKSRKLSAVSLQLFSI